MNRNTVLTGLRNFTLYYSTTGKSLRQYPFTIPYYYNKKYGRSRIQFCAVSGWLACIAMDSEMFTFEESELGSTVCSDHNRISYDHCQEHVHRSTFYRHI